MKCRPFDPAPPNEDEARSPDGALAKSGTNLTSAPGLRNRGGAERRPVAPIRATRCFPHGNRSSAKRRPSPCETPGCATRCSHVARIGRRGGIGEGAMGCKPGAPVGLRIEALQQQYLVGGHLRHIEPLMIRIVFDRIGLTDAMRIDQIRSDEVVWFDRAGIADRQRRVEQRSLDRPPQIDDLHPALQELIGLVGEEIADAMWA